MEIDFHPGDVNLDELILTSADGYNVVDIRGQARHIDIYEGVNDSFLYGEIIIADGIDLKNTFPIIGEERVLITFNTPTFKPITMDLRVYAVENIQRTDNNRLTIYTLKVASVEYLTNASKRITKRYKGQISDFIKQIVTDDLGSSKKFDDVEATQGIDDFLIASANPLAAIDTFRLRSFSPEFKSSSYCFYEDREGYHFKTLEKMIKDKKAEATQTGAATNIRSFYYDDNIDRTITQVRFRDVLGFNQLNDQNTIDRIEAGAFNNLVHNFDMFTGEMTEIKYESQINKDIFQQTATKERFGTDPFVEKYGKEPAQTFLVPFSSERENDNVGEKMGHLHSFIEQVAQNLAHMLIYGDSSLMIGDMIAVNYTNPVDKDSKSEEDQEIITRNFLVSHIRHQITVSTRPVYLQSLEMMNSSYDY